MSLPSVSIVIPTRNRVDALRLCLDRLIPYVSGHPECEIVVSDDGDASRTAEALGAEGRVRILQGPRRGPAANRNWGASHSAGEIIVFLDDDCTPDPDLIATYQAAALAKADAGVFEGRITPVGDYSTLAHVAPSNETGGYLWSCNFAVRRDVFLGAGGFDERFPFAAVEDCDLHHRLRARTSIPFLPDARVWHQVEPRFGWKGVQHESLSVLLYLHIHGLAATNRNSLHFVRMAAQRLLKTGTRHLLNGTFKHPSSLFYKVWANLQIAFILAFWKFRSPLARFFYRPCCQGCQSIHAELAKESASWLSITQENGSSLPILVHDRS